MIPLLLFLIMTAQLGASETVVLLHGLARSPKSMEKMAHSLRAEGYSVINLGYESRRHSIEELAVGLRREILECTAQADRVHFVTHSMGGIVLRRIQATDPLPKIGRVVMLSPPNRGSEVVDRIGHWWLFKKINGPAGGQLGTPPKGLPGRLPPVDFECGILTGTRSINWINSCMIPGPDDGKVSVASARLPGMTSFKTVPATHPFIMKKRSVIRDTLAFLAEGQFPGERTISSPHSAAPDSPPP